MEREPSPLVVKNLYSLLQGMPTSELHELAGSHGGVLARVCNLIIDDRRDKPCSSPTSTK